MLPETAVLTLKTLLILTLMFPIFGILVVLIIPTREEKMLKVIALNFACFPFVSSLMLWSGFHKGVGAFQQVIQLFWIPSLNLHFTLGVDGISLLFLLLTTLLVPLCLLTCWNSIKVNLKEFLIAFLTLDFLLIGVFCALDLLFFYTFFESVLIPMFFIIGIWGSRERKILAAYYFFLYTLLGSVVMLISILYIYWQLGTTDYELLLAFNLSELEQKLLWFAFFLAFASKIPMFPFHLWLPEAHVEAPTAGSVVLAGVLLKLGIYGFIRFSLPLLPKACFFFSPLIYTIAVISILYSSFTAIRQTDFKRIVAYISIAHMNLVVLGIFSFNVVGIEGAIFQSLSHGFVASALFLVIGVVYDRYKTRIVTYFGGLASVMPVLAILFLLFTLANIGLPGTSSFVGEFLILAGSFKANVNVTFLGATGIVLSGAYSLWLYNRIAYGSLKTQYTLFFSDVSLREFTVFCPLVLGILITGICPDIFLKTMHISINNLSELFCF